VAHVHVFGVPSVQPVAFAPHASPLPTQAPFVHTSVVVQLWPSLHAVVLATGDLPHEPAAHTPTLHWSFWAEQSIAVPWQAPPEHWSPTVHGLPSLQVAVLFTFLQPSTGSQLSSVQPLPSSQLMGVPPLHTPEWHVLPVAQALPWSHALPSFAGCAEHVPVDVLQTPALHSSFDDEQSTSAVGWHVPALSLAHA
jgi:hypothetical protein